MRIVMIYKGRHIFSSLSMPGTLLHCGMLIFIIYKIYNTICNIRSAIYTIQYIICNCHNLGQPNSTQGGILMAKKKTENVNPNLNSR